MPARGALAAAAVAALAVGFLHPGLRESDGHLSAAAAFVLSSALAALAATSVHACGWRRAAPWAGLAALLQAAGLQLVDAGSRLHYEHLSLAGGLELGAHGPWLAVLAGGAVAVAVAVRARAPALRAGLRALLGTRPRAAAAALALTLVVTSAFPSRDPGFLAREVALSLVLRLLQLGTLAVLLAALHQDLRERGRGLRDLLAGRESGLDGLAVACALWVALVSLLLVTTAYERHPHVTDEVAYLLHARIFAAGQLSIPAPRVPEAFEIYLVACRDGRCLAPTYPGWPAVLAAGVRLGAPWLVNPLLGALGLLLTFALVRRLYDARTARLTALLLALSPWYLLVSMSFMTHPLSLVCALGAGWAVVVVHRGGALGWAGLGGLALGVLSLVRPLEGLCAALVLGLAALAQGRERGALRGVAAASLLALGALAAGSLNLVYNRAISGSALDFPIMAYADEALGPGRNALGFGPDKGVEWGGIDPFPGHGWRDVVVNAQLNATGIDRELFGWSVGSLGLVALLLATARLRPRGRDGWLLLAAALPPAAHSLYWYSGGPDFAARYWYLSIVPLVALAARGLLALAEEAETRPARQLAWLAPLALSAIAVLVFLPWRAIDKYTHFRGMRSDVRRLAERPELKGALVLVRGDDYPDAASALVYNDLDPESSAPLFVWARDAELEARLRAAYPDRTLFVLEGPTRTGGAYRLEPAPRAP